MSMSNILYVVDNNDKKDYTYHLKEDAVIYHFSINSSSNVNITLEKENIKLYYYYNNINYDNNAFNIEVTHQKDDTTSELFIHGVNVKGKKLDYEVNGIVPKNSNNCLCNQENQIINIGNGKSTIHPNLLIDNFNVESNHSAYIGKIKEDKVFYLMSRGLSKKEAYQLLLKGFLINMDSIDMNRIKKFQKELEKI